MTDELSHGEILELLGAYALDAVDGRERELIEAHLPTCDSCRAEFDDHRRMAETLRRHAVRVSPLASTESNGSPTTIRAVDHLGRLGRWGIPTAIAITLLLVAGLFVQAQVRYHQLAASTSRVERLERALLATADPAAVVATLRNPGDEPVLTVVERGGHSYAVNSSLPRLAAGQTYQLWRVDNAGVTAAAALGPHPDAVQFSLPTGVTGLIVTVEKGLAPSHPTLPAIATGAGATR